MGEANTLKARGEIRLQTGNLQEAEKYFDAAISLHRDVVDRLGAANALRARSIVLLETDRLQEAEEDCQAAISLYRAVGDRMGEANVRQVRGQLEAARKKWPEALTLFHLAREFYVSVDEAIGLCNVDTELARTYSAMGDSGAAVQAAVQALRRGIHAQYSYARAMSIKILKRHDDAIPDELRGELAEFLKEG